MWTTGSWFGSGDRQARAKEIYAACGRRLDPAEPPPSICPLHAALSDRGSRHALVLDAVAATLPPPDEARREAARPAAAGPLVEVRRSWT